MLVHLGVFQPPVKGLNRKKSWQATFLGVRRIGHADERFEPVSWYTCFGVSRYLSAQKELETVGLEPTGEKFSTLPPRYLPSPLGADTGMSGRHPSLAGWEPDASPQRFYT